MRRISVAGLIGVIAVGLAALRSATDLWLRIMMTLTVAALAVGLLGAIVRPRPRGAWVGFAVFGWGSYVAAFVPILDDGRGGRTEIAASLLSEDLVGWLAAILNRRPTVPEGYMQGPGEPGELYHFAPHLPVRVLPDETNDPSAREYLLGYPRYQARAKNLPRIGHSLLCLLLGFVGSILGRTLSAPRGNDLRPPG